MARKPTGNPNGRPPKQIDEKQFKNLCAIHCTVEEIAAVNDCSVDTVREWCKRTFGETFAVVYKRFAAAGNASLRRSQFKMAEKSVPMAIFLGKNWLNQSDKNETVVMEVEDLSTLADMLRDNPADTEDADGNDKDTDD